MLKHCSSGFGITGPLQQRKGWPVAAWARPCPTLPVPWKSVPSQGRSRGRGTELVRYGEPDLLQGTWIQRRTLSYDFLGLYPCALEAPKESFHIIAFDPFVNPLVARRRSPSAVAGSTANSTAPGDPGRPYPRIRHQRTLRPPTSGRRFRSPPRQRTLPAVDHRLAWLDPEVSGEPPSHALKAIPSS
jgi:hypothetical protein